MKAISENLSERGKHGMKYRRRRIPSTALLEAYPRPKTRITLQFHPEITPSGSFLLGNTGAVQAHTSLGNAPYGWD